MKEHVPPSIEKIHALVATIIASTTTEHPDASPAELLSAVFSTAKSFVAVILDHNNDAFNREQILKCCGEIEIEVWNREPKKGIN